MLQQEVRQVSVVPDSVIAKLLEAKDRLSRLGWGKHVPVAADKRRCLIGAFMPDDAPMSILLSFGDEPPESALHGKLHSDVVSSHEYALLTKALGDAPWLVNDVYFKSVDDAYAALDKAIALRQKELGL